MRQHAPIIFLGLFICAVVLRTGHISYDYVQDSFQLHAAEKETEKAIASEMDAELNTVTKKILNDDIEKKDKNNFAAKAAGKTIDEKTDKVCITGPLLEHALKQLEYLSQREAEILEQQRLLETSDRRIREQLAKLKLIKYDLVESAKLADSTIQKESKKLITIYEKMKPKEAAKIFNEMDPAIAAELLRTMKEDKSSMILSKMNPKNAYNITLSLSGGFKKTIERYKELKVQ